MLTGAFRVKTHIYASYRLRFYFFLRITVGIFLNSMSRACWPCKWSNVTNEHNLIIQLLSLKWSMQVLYFVFYFVAVLGVKLDDFYPYGSQNGDTAMSKNDDGSSPDIPISSLFPFFNHQHSKLTVSILCFHVIIYGCIHLPTFIDKLSFLKLHPLLIQCDCPFD